MAVNGRVCENYPRIAEEALKLDWEFMGHGYLQGPMHKHDDHEQLGIIFRGALDFRIGEEDTQERSYLNTGDVYVAPKGVWHGDSIFIGDAELDECWILDIFSPPRDDLRKSDD